MRIAFDTNILAYLAGVDRAPEDGRKIDLARAALAGMAGRATLIAPTQTLGELFVVLLRAGAPREEARAIVLRFRETFAGADTSDQTLLSALDLAVAHKLQLWDALILSAAADAGCARLLSEDMQEGFVWRGVTVTNPLKTPIEIGS
jgi:predicted nucleic acid-binding protein